MLTVGVFFDPRAVRGVAPGVDTAVRSSVGCSSSTSVSVTAHTLQQPPHSVEKKLRKRVTGAVGCQQGDADCNNNSVMSLESESIAFITEGSHFIPILIVFNP